MPAVRGDRLLIKRGDGEVSEAFVTVGAVRNSSVSINGNPIDVTTVDDIDENDEIWRTHITGIKDLTVSGDGIGKAIEPIQSMYEDFATGAIVNYEITVKWVGVFVVAMIIESMEFTGPYDGVQGFSFSMRAAGAPTFTPESAS